MPNKLNLNLLRTFESVARKGSVQGAADELFVTASAVSKQITALEDVIGERLFERTTKGLLLTDGGRHLLVSVQEPLAEMDGALAPWIRHRMSKTIRITSVPSIATRVLAGLMPGLLARFPHHTFNVMTTPRVVSLVDEGWDIGLRLGKGEWKETEATELPGSEMILIGGADDEANKGLAILQHENSLEWERWAAEAGGEVPQSGRVVVMNDWNAILAAVAANTGIALVPRLLAHGLLRQKTARQLSPVTVPGRRQFYVVIANEASAYRPRLAPVVREVRDWLTAAIADWLEK